MLIKFLKSCLKEPKTLDLDIDSPETTAMNHLTRMSRNGPPPKGGPLSRANSALPWIVFKRDRAQFEDIYPEWKINKIVLHSPFRYLISGGVSFKCLMPGYFFPLWTRFEALLDPWMHTWAMFARIVLTRKE